MEDQDMDMVAVDMVDTVVGPMEDMDMVVEVHMEGIMEGTQGMDMGGTHITGR